MNWITILTLIVTAAYLIHTGIIPSISDSYRTIRDIRIYHTFFFVSAILIACQGIYAREALHIPYLIAAFCFYGLSLASSFWKQSEGWLHVIFTYSAIAIGLTMTIIRVWPWWGIYSLGLLLAMGIGALLIHVLLKRNRTYWQEVFAYGVIFGPIIVVLK